jgi:uncharacterized protein
VDVARKRIGLSMKLDAAPARKDAPRDNRFEPANRNQRGGAGGAGDGGGGGSGAPRQDRGQAAPSAMASAFSKLQGLKR